MQLFYINLERLQVKLPLNMCIYENLVLSSMQQLNYAYGICIKWALSITFMYTYSKGMHKCFLEPCNLQTFWKKDDYKTCNSYMFISSNKITRHDKITKINTNPSQYIKNKSCTTQYITKPNIILQSLKIKIKVIQYHSPKSHIT